MFQLCPPNNCAVTVFGTISGLALWTGVPAANQGTEEESKLGAEPSLLWLLRAYDGREPMGGSRVSVPQFTRLSLGVPRVIVSPVG